MKSRPIQALESNLGSRFLLRASRPHWIRNRQSRADTGTPSSPPSIGDQAIWPRAGCYEHAPPYTRAAMQEPVCGLQLKMERAAAFAASTPAGTRVQRSRRAR